MSGFFSPPVDVRNGIKVLLSSINFVQSIMICGEHLYLAFCILLLNVVFFLVLCLVVPCV